MDEGVQPYRGRIRPWSYWMEYQEGKLKEAVGGELFEQLEREAGNDIPLGATGGRS